MQLQSIRSKLLLSFLVAILFTFSAACFSLYNFQRTEKVLEDVRLLNNEARVLFEMKGISQDIQAEMPVLFDTKSAQSSTREEKKGKILASLRELNGLGKEYELAAVQHDGADVSLARNISNSSNIIAQDISSFGRTAAQSTSTNPQVASAEDLRTQEHALSHMEELASGIDMAIRGVEQNLVKAGRSAKELGYVASIINSIIVLLNIILIFMIGLVVLKGMSKSSRSALHTSSDEVDMKGSQQVVPEPTKEENMYQLLLSSIGEGVVVTDSNKIITLVNRAAEEALGYSATNLLGRSLSDTLTLVNSKGADYDHSFWKNVLQSKRSMIPEGDISILTKDKKNIPVFLTASPIIDSEERKTKGIIITFRNVREERALEEVRVGFISTASHQLRTPLTSIRWFSEMLLGGDAGELNEEQKHFVQRVYQGTERMISLVNLLLRLARVEAGRVRVEPVPTNLKTLIETVASSLRMLSDERHQKVEISSNPARLSSLNLDQEMVWHVVQNLLSNAIRYGNPGSVIHIDVQEEDEYITCSVRDAGMGIPKVQQHRLFEKFFRADNAIEAVPEGSGLGLPLVKSLVEGWGGKIWFESVENTGSTFSFTIPRSGMKQRGGEVRLTI